MKSYTIPKADATTSKNGGMTQFLCGSLIKLICNA